MDEWAQAHSLRTTFKQGTPHIHGGGNGTVFFYLVSGIMLLPFYLLRIVNPFAIKSSLGFIDVQQKLFEVLRLQSILYGVLSIVLISYLAKKYFKSNKILAAFLFTVNPIFFILSQFYRYDTPVVFWILLSLLFSLRYLQNPTKKNLSLSFFIAGLAATTKVSALPLMFTCLFSFFLVTSLSEWLKKYTWLILGVLIFIGTFILTGIPDAFISFHQFVNWFFLFIYLSVC
jgi:4-amino-4-deoxy-L-arabinose transferase-like glycosyltransferase